MSDHTLNGTSTRFSGAKLQLGHVTNMRRQRVQNLHGPASSHRYGNWANWPIARAYIAQPRNRQQVPCHCSTAQYRKATDFLSTTKSKYNNPGLASALGCRHIKQAPRVKVVNYINTHQNKLNETAHLVFIRHTKSFFARIYSFLFCILSICLPAFYVSVWIHNVWFK